MLNAVRSNKDYDVNMLDMDINKMISYYTRSNARYIAGFMSKFESDTFDEVLEIRKRYMMF